MTRNITRAWWLLLTGDGVRRFRCRLFPVQHSGRPGQHFQRRFPLHGPFRPTDETHEQRTGERNSTIAVDIINWFRCTKIAVVVGRVGTVPRDHER